MTFVRSRAAGNERTVCRLSKHARVALLGLALIPILVMGLGCDDDKCTTKPEPAVPSLFLEAAFFPSWSPDGAELVCCRPTPSYSDESVQIWSVSATGEDPDTLIYDPNGAFHPKWLPDGRHVVYYRVRRNLETVKEFVVHDLDGGDPVVWPVSMVEDDLGFSISPDGSEVLYTSGDQYEVRALNLSDGSTRHVVDGASGVISPNGEWIAYLTAVDTLAIAPVDGGGPPVYAEVQLVDEFGCPSWTSNSEYVILTHVGTSGNVDLFAFKRDGSSRRQLTDDPEWDRTPAVSLQGNKLAYTRSEGEFWPLEVWVLDLDL